MTNAGNTKNAAGEFTKAPENAKIDIRVVKKMLGEALMGIDGLLDVKGGFADILKDSDDPTKGISVRINDEQAATVQLKIVTEAGKNIPNIVNAATSAITQTLQNTAGLRAKEVLVEVSDTMTRAGFEAQKSGDAATMPPA